MSSIEPYDLVFVGHYTKDTIVYPASTHTHDGGGYFFGATIAARMGLRVAVVTRLSCEDWSAVKKLERFGVTMLARPARHSTVLRLIYPTANLDQRTIELSSWAGPFASEDVADVRARAYIIAASSVRGEVPLAVISTLAARGALISLDVQGFIRVLGDGHLEQDAWPGKEEILPLVTILKTDAAEAALLTGETDRAAAARRLAEYGPREVLVTSSAGVLLYHDGRITEAPFTPRQLLGRSGRGDTCTGAYVAKRLSAPPEEALAWAAAVTTLKLEAEGPFNREMSEVEELYRQILSTI